MPTTESELRDLAEKLQRHFDGQDRSSQVSVGVGDGLHVYSELPVESLILPTWLSESGVSVRFHTTGMVRPC